MRTRGKRDIQAGIAWLLVFLLCFCFPHLVIENVIADEPWGIYAGRGIQAGDDFGIYAGLRVRVSQKELYAIVSAKVKPNNLVCGVWKELKGTSE